MRTAVVLAVSFVMGLPFFCLLAFAGAEPITPGHRPVKAPCTQEHMSSVGREVA